MLRLIMPADTIPLIDLTAATDYFKPLEITALREVFEDYFKEEINFGHRCYGEFEGDRPLGYVYYAPVPMTEGTWCVYWIAVAKDQQGKGLGTRLINFVEKEARDHNGRLLLLETSSLTRYDSTREFYKKRGYSVASHIPDYYADGDGLVVFCKRL